MKKPARKTTVRQFLADFPQAVALGKRLGQAITNKRIPLKGNHYDILTRALDYERRGVGYSIEHFFDEEEKHNAKKSELKN
jgi:hypothetical protein